MPSAIEDSLLWESARANPTSIAAGQPLQWLFWRLHPTTGNVVPVWASKRRCVLVCIPLAQMFALH
jgi:hypothetical protein